MNRKLLLLIVLLALLPACAKKSPYTPVPVPPQRMVLKGYSVMPLDEPGWVSIKGNDELMLSRYGASIDETQVVMASVVQVPPVRTPQELEQFFKRTMLDDVYSGRYEPVSQDIKSLTYQGASCVRSHLVSIDRYPVTFAEGDKTMMLESYQQLCLHPDAPQVGVVLEYSQHYYPGNNDPAFGDKAGKVFDGLRFRKP